MESQMADYKTHPLNICASALGGADVDVSATILVDDVTSQVGDATLTDVHLARECANIRAHKKTGVAKLRLIYVVVPLVGNGQFSATVEVSHPKIANSPRKITRTGDAKDGPKTYSTTFVLPE
jgi:hypothetical protein